MSSKPNKFLGVDLGSTSIKIVELEDHKDTPKLVTYGYAEYSADITEKDEDEKIDQIVSIIKRIYKEANMTTNYALAAMPGVKVFTSIVNLPKMSHRDLESAIYWEAKKFIPMDIEDVVLDWKELDDKHKKVGMDGKGLSDMNEQIDAQQQDIKAKKNDKNIKILLTAAPKKLVEKYIKIFKKLNFQLLSLETESFALSRALVGADPSSTLLVDLGSNNTDIIIVEEGIPVLSRSIEAGGDQITQQIAEKTGMAIDKAEQFKRDFIFDPQDDTTDKIKETVDAIVEEIRSSLALYDSQEGKQVDKVILSGGTADLEGLVEYFTKKLDKVVVVGNPWEQIIHPKELSPALKQLAPRFAVSLGLAMREID